MNIQKLYVSDYVYLIKFRGTYDKVYQCETFK